MTPARMIHGDCRSVALPASFFDVIVADPPYAVTPLEWDRVASGWLAAVAPALKPNGTVWIFGSMRSLLRDSADLAGWKIAQDLVMEKHNCSGPVTQRKYARVHEHALQIYRGKWSDVFARQTKTSGHDLKSCRRKEMNLKVQGDFGESSYASTDRITRSVIRCATPRHADRHHPTQKPSEIIREILTYSAPTGGAVLDPFAGSGVTLDIAEELGLFAVGVEKAQDYVDSWNRRHAHHTACDLPPDCHCRPAAAEAEGRDE